MAQKKFTQLTEETAPLSTDITAMTKDPAGTPVSRKATFANIIQKAHGLSNGWAKVVAGVMTTVASLTKSDVGLGNVDNTSDVNKPVSTAQQTAIDGKVADAINNGVIDVAPSQNAVFDALALKEATANKGTAGGYAELDGSGKVPSAQLPSFVDDVLEYANFASFPVTGESGKIYVDLATNITYRWSGSSYVTIGSSLALGETSTTAYRGDRGKTAYDHSQLTSGNPHNVTKTDVGLGNVTNDAQVKADFSGYTDKATPVDADTTTINDSAASGAVKKLSWANIKATLKTYFDTLYIQDSLFDAEGDLIVGDANDTPKKLAIGERASVLTPNASGELSYAQVIKHPVRVPVGSYFLSSRAVGVGYNASGTSSTAANSNNRTKNTPFTVDEITRVDRIALYLVGTNDTGSLRLGIYEDDGSGNLGTVVADGGLSSTATSGVKTQTIDAVLYPDKIYHAVAMTEALNTAGGNPTFAVIASSTANTPEDAPAASNNMFTYKVWAIAAGGLTNNPTPPVNSRSLQSGSPHIWIRRAAL